MKFLKELIAEKKCTVISLDTALFFGTVLKVKTKDKKEDDLDQVFFDIEDFYIDKTVEDIDLLFKQDVKNKIEENNVKLLGYSCQVRGKSLKKNNDLLLLLKAGFVVTDTKNNDIFLQLTLGDV